MKQVCIHCQRQSPGGNLWCTESNCATQLKPMVLEYGQSLADLTIKKALAVLHTSVIYEATQGEETDVLLKIAHDGFEDRLKREARFLADLQTKNKTSVMLPTLLPAYPEASVATYPYGKTVIRDKTMYYTLYDHQDGGILRGMLLKNSQPWFQDVGWIALGLCDAIQLIHQNSLFHLNLSPDIILVRYAHTKDKKRFPIPVLLDLGMISGREPVNADVVQASNNTAYIAPEFFHGTGVNFGRRTDVYGLGLLMYEMFAGHPAYPFELRPDVEVRRAIERGNKLKRLDRPDLDPNLVAFVNQMLRPYEQRPETISQTAEYLHTYFPPVPTEKKKRKFNWRIFWIIIATILIIMTALIVAYVLADPQRGVALIMP